MRVMNGAKVSKDEVQTSHFTGPCFLTEGIYDLKLIEKVLNLQYRLTIEFGVILLVAHWQHVGKGCNLKA